VRSFVHSSPVISFLLLSFSSLCVFGTQAFIRYAFCKYFLSVFSLSFHSWKSIFSSADFNHIHCVLHTKMCVISHFWYGV
jgi:hypothetical protein